jgi:hypothetical protein
MINNLTWIVVLKVCQKRLLVPLTENVTSSHSIQIDTGLWFPRTSILSRSNAHGACYSIRHV